MNRRKPLPSRPKPVKHSVQSRASNGSSRLKEAEEALRESDERYKLLFNGSGVGILLTTPDGGILAANKAACRMFKRTEKEICRAGRDGLVDISDSRLRRYVRERKRTGKFRGELNLIRGDGTRFIGLVSSTIFKGRDGKLRTSMIVQDITERKRMEDAIASWARFPSENPNPVLRLTPEGRILVANKASAALLKEWGIKTGGKVPDFLTHLAEASYKSGKKKTADVECGRCAFSFVIVPIPKGGYVNLYGTDITERKRTADVLLANEKRLRQSTELLEAVTKGSRMLVATVDREFRYTFFNKEHHRELKRITGKTTSIGMRLMDVLADMPDQLKIAIDLWGRALKGETVERVLEFGDPGRYRRYYKTRHVPIRDRDGAVTGAGEVTIDVTELMQAQDALQRLNRMLKALSDSSQAMMMAGNESEYLNEVCRIVVEDCGHAMVWIGFAEEDEAKSVRPVAHAGFEEGYLETLNITWADTERGRGPTGMAIRTGKPSLCRNMLIDRDFAPWREQAKKRDYASSVVLPLATNGKVFGAINIYSKEENPFSGGEVVLLSELASDLSFGIAAIRLRLAHARSEEALRETGTYLQNLLDYANAPIIVWDPDFRITQFNRAFERMTGHAAGAVIGKHLDLLFPDDGRDASMALIKQTSGGEKWESVEIPILRRDGGVRVALWNSANIYAPDGRTPVATIAQGQDITERKRIEEALKESEERYKLAQKAAGIGTWDWDIATGRLKWSEEVADLFGISMDSFQGTIEAFMRLINPDDRKQFETAIDACLEQGTEFRIMHRVNHPDGTVRWLIERGNVIRNDKNLALRMLAVVIDITNMRKANEERARLAEIVGASWDAVIGSTPEGVLTSWNPGAERMFGFPENEMVGRPFSLIVPRDKEEEFWEALERIKKGKRIGYMETKRKTKSGKIIDVSLSLSPITDASGKVIALSSIERDITHRKQMEEALKKSRDELEQRVRERTVQLEKVNQTLQAEAAEKEQTQKQLRSLTAILAKTEERERRRIATDLHDRIIQTLVYANMKLGELRKFASGAGVPETAEEVGRYVQQTIHDLRTLTFELSPPVLYELGFVPAVKWLIRQFEEKHDLVVEFQENDVPETIDEDVRIVLFQALRELLNNAVKHAGAGCVKVSLYRDENALKAVVEDDGVGFDSGKAAMNAKNNTGFGLFNIRQRLESVHGGLSIETRPGAGTRIEMTAPLFTK
jgi:PAS domain S-box-containing protein